MRHSNFLGKVHIILADISPALVVGIRLPPVYGAVCDPAVPHVASLRRDAI